MEKREIGSFGERKAEEYLNSLGFRTVRKNFTCRFGEVDIIAEDGKYLVFAEVKLRKNDMHGSAAEFVTPAKQKKIRKTAEYWLYCNETELQPRFDVIEIYTEAGSGEIKINHIDDAFW